MEPAHPSLPHPHPHSLPHQGRAQWSESRSRWAGTGLPSLQASSNLPQAPARGWKQRYGAWGRGGAAPRRRVKPRPCPSGTCGPRLPPGGLSRIDFHLSFVPANAQSPAPAPVTSSPLHRSPLPCACGCCVLDPGIPEQLQLFPAEGREIKCLRHRQAQEFPLTWLPKSESHRHTFIPHALGMEMPGSIPSEHPPGQAVASLSEFHSLRSSVAVKVRHQEHLFPLRILHL